MSFRQGYGNTQEDYLVGDDKVLRSDTFIGKESFNVKAQSIIDNEAISHSIDGKNGLDIVQNYNNKEVLSAYTPIDIENDIRWHLISQIEKSEVQELPNSIRTDIILISLVILVLIVIGILFLSKILIIKPLEQVKIGLDSLFAYINKESNSFEYIKSTSNDELGQMAQSINKNMARTEKIIEEDSLFIDNVQEIMDGVENCCFAGRIDTHTTNESLLHLKDTINNALDNLHSRIININDTLEQYANLDYRKSIQIKGVNPTGVFYGMLLNINQLRDTINDMLIDNKSNGLTLDNSSDILLENVTILNNNINKSATLLKDSSESLKKVTNNITNTTTNIVKISDYTNELTNSVNLGHELANKTVKSMNDIDKEISSISEFISVIDQISFQTNILSLNAAVEAATAGESGKGFAVVAQEVRNLAGRSAESVKQIESLVQNASTTSNNGKNISHQMIKGYSNLNSNITKTIELIKEVEMSSKEYKDEIVDINTSINNIDNQLQENTDLSDETYNAAKVTDTIAKLVVEHANQKEFDNKDSVKAKNLNEIL
jgi:methyl-accepting chemotaxis protein